MLKNVTSTEAVYFDSSLTEDMTILYDSGFKSYTAAGSNLDVVTYTATADCIAFLFIVTSNTGNTTANYCGARITQSGSAVGDDFQWYQLNCRGQQRKNSGALDYHRLYICTDTSDTTVDPHPNYGFVLPTGGNIIGRIASNVTSGAKGHMRLICASASPVSFLKRYTRV